MAPGPLLRGSPMKWPLADCQDLRRGSRRRRCIGPYREVCNKGKENKLRGSRAKGNHFRLRPCFSPMNVHSDHSKPVNMKLMNQE